VLGWFFAAAVLTLVKGGILTLLPEPKASNGTPATLEQTAQAWFFWAGVGILAGINERWARDLVTRGHDGVPSGVTRTIAPVSRETRNDGVGGGGPAGDRSREADRSRESVGDAAVDEG
jgi:hypothetical protein